MYIYQVVECYGADTTIITENIDILFENLINDFLCNIQIIIWNNGKMIYKTKQYNEKDFSFDDIYIEIMNFINSK